MRRKSGGGLMDSRCRHRSPRPSTLELAVVRRGHSWVGRDALAISEGSGPSDEPLVGVR